MSNPKDDEKKQEEERESDTVAASIVRDTLGDEAAKDFKSIFGDWF